MVGLIGNSYQVEDKLLVVVHTIMATVRWWYHITIILASHHYLFLCSRGLQKRTEIFLLEKGEILYMVLKMITCQKRSGGTKKDLYAYLHFKIACDDVFDILKRYVFSCQQQHDNVLLEGNII